MKNKKILFWVIVGLLVFAGFIIQENKVNLGLDLVGGSRLVLEAQTTENVKEITPDILDSLVFAIEKRINKDGVNETIVQKSGTNRIIVEIPNISDPKKAKEIIGQTAELEFKRPGMPGMTGEETWLPTNLSGRDVKKAVVNPGQGGNWEIGLEFTGEGAKKFAKLTTELVGKPMAIFFNNENISSPRINEPITGGQARITGEFTYEQAKEMVDLINAGALPVPAKIIEENTVGPTLGADSVKKSLFAGMVGIGFVMLFMILYYRLPGLIADIALCIYTVFVYAVFVNPIQPVTLTLAGIAGFILSIGMAVDANILIFERTKEELKSGKTYKAALHSGFDRAFTSIFDSNMTTIITCVILYMLGTTLMKGFAYTLAIGVVLSMFTAITVTRNFMELLFADGRFNKPFWFGIKQSDIKEVPVVQETTKNRAKYNVLD